MQVTLSVTDALKANTLSALSSVYFFFVEAHDSFTRGNLSFGVGACWGVRLSVELQSLSPERGADGDGTGLHVFVARKSLLPSHRHEKLLAVARISFFL